MPSVLMEHIENPKNTILEKVGDLDGIEIFGNDVLLAVYERPNKTASGIILADQSREEDRWQGKCHLVLKIGPTAFLDDDGKRFRDINEGDWVVMRPSDGQLVTLNTLKRAVSSKDSTVLCRIADDLSIRMRIAHPDSIY